MTYKETTDWMFQQLPMFQMQGALAYKKDLTNTLLLVDYLNHPETKFKSNSLILPLPLMSCWYKSLPFLIHNFSLPFFREKATFYFFVEKDDILFL